MSLKARKKAPNKIVRILAGAEVEVYAGRLRDDLAGLMPDGFSLELASGAILSNSNELIELIKRDRAIIFVTATDFSSPTNKPRLRLLAQYAKAILPIGPASSPVQELHHLFLRAISEDKVALQISPSAETIRHVGLFLWSLASRGTQGDTQRAHREEMLNECKLILVGRGEVGKTSIVKRLVSAGFDGDESKTQGINITNWLCPVGEDIIRLNVWDFGGQEIMHATHQFFLTEQSLYLLVLNGRSGAEDLDVEYWLKHIQGFGGNSPVIIVQNKIRQQPFELNYRGLMNRYPQIRDFVQTDCADKFGIGKLQDSIKAALASMPEVKMTFHADWFKVKKRLEAMAEEYVEYQQFVELCREEGVNTEADRDRLRFVMHCLGIALNYRDDIRLRETSVLKPKWVTDGIYKILNAKELAERQGELHLNDLPRILPPERYPLHRHSFLFELMRKFSLCFSFQDEQDRYLVPELLGKEQPENVTHFAPDDCLNFEYRYGVLPEGLLPRFIVRTHVLSRERPRWRSGVILTYEGCEALVQAEPLERRIIVRIKGANSTGRRNLLAIIRFDLKRIHNEFKDRLDAQEKVAVPKIPELLIDYNKLVGFEKQGIRTFPEYVGQEVVTVNVDDLLNGVDFAEERHHAKSEDRAKSIFFSYSHRDESLRDELETHLKLLERKRIISTWHDRKILPGQEWDHEIDVRLERANIILMLISSDFMASQYCWDNEVSRAIERHNAKLATVIPIILRPCDWTGAPFSHLQGLPTGMRPITDWPNRDQAWSEVAKSIRVIAEQGR